METSFVLFFLAAASACFLSSSSASRSRRSLYDASSPLRPKPESDHCIFARSAAPFFSALIHTTAGTAPYPQTVLDKLSLCGGLESIFIHKLYTLEPADKMLLLRQRPYTAPVAAVQTVLSANTASRTAALKPREFLSGSGISVLLPKSSPVLTVRSKVLEFIDALHRFFLSRPMR